MADNNPSQQSFADLFASLKEELTERLSKLLQLPVHIQGSSPQNIEDMVHALGSSLFEIPLDIAGSRLHIFIGREHAESMGVVLGVTADRAVQILSREWAQCTAKLCSTIKGQLLPSMMYDPRTVSSPSLEIYGRKDDVQQLLFKTTVGNSELAVGLAMPKALCKGSKEQGGKDMAEETKKQHPPQTKDIARLTPTSARTRRRRANHRQVKIEPATFGELTLSEDPGLNREIDLVEDVHLPIVAEVGSTEITLGDIMELEVGSVVALDKMAGQPSDLFINGYAIAKAEVIVLDDNFGLRIQEIVPAEERIRRR